MDCLFCHIVSGKIKSYKVFEDDLVYAFLDIQPLSKGHTLIIPKKHAKDIRDIDEDSLMRVAVVAKKLANKYEVALGAEGFNLRNSSGEIAHQDVFHFHLHLVPRYHDDGLNLVAQHSDKGINVEQVFNTLTASDIAL